MWEKGIVSSVINCQGRIEAYEPGSIENPKIELGNIVQPVNAIIQQFSDKSTKVICPYFDEKENFCKALEAAPDSEESRKLIADRASFVLNYSLQRLESDDDRCNKLVQTKTNESIVLSTGKCPYKIDL